jgi:hypothetical protein
MITVKDMWGRMISCGRLAIGLARFVPSSKPITNRLQVSTNHLLKSRTGLHTRQIIEIKSDAPEYGFVLPNRLFGKWLKWPDHAQPRLTLMLATMLRHAVMPPACPT